MTRHEAIEKAAEELLEALECEVGLDDWSDYAQNKLQKALALPADPPTIRESRIVADLAARVERLERAVDWLSRQTGSYEHGGVLGILSGPEVGKE